MKAALVHGVGDIRIEEVPRPECDDASIIVKIHKASICNGSDGAVFKGERDLLQAYPFLKFPVIGGHESSGEIVEKGRAVRGLKVGDRVTYWCQVTGAFAEYCKITPGRLSIIKLSDNIPYSVGSFMEMLGSTMKYAAEVKLGQTVAVFGLGPAGQLLVQESRIAGAAEVIAVDRVQSRIDRAREFGATMAVNADEDNVVERILEKCGHLDICIDATGVNIVDLVSHIAAPGRGRYLMYGCPDKGITMDGTYTFYHCFPEVMRRPHSEVDHLMRQGDRLISQGRLKLEPLITHHIPLADVEQGIRMVSERPEECIKVVIDITDQEF